MIAKIVMHDGVLQGVFMDAEAKSTHLKLDIVDADSDRDTETAVRHELTNPDLEEVDITVRHPGNI